MTASKGDVVKYQVIVKNIGQATAKNVYVNDNNPTGVQPLSNITVSTSFTGGIPQGISIGDLQAGSSVTVTYQGTVNVTASTNDVNINNTATVSSDNAASQTAQALVTVPGTASSNNGGSTTNNNCVNLSCNTTTTTTTNTDNSVNNSNNTTNTNNSVNNSNNSTVTNSYTYNNTVYISSNGNVVPANQFSQLSITKGVRNSFGGTYGNSVNVNNGDTAQFEIVVTNTGSATANNVRVTDTLPGGLSLIPGSITVNGTNASDNNLYNGMYLGNLTSGQPARIDFQVSVNGNTSASIQNIANASSDNAGTVQASAWVFINGTGNVLGSNVNLSYSKSAFNNTKNQDASSIAASKEDYITYTLTVSNSGNSPANNFIITDDLSQVLPYADMSDNGGGSLNGNIITFPGITVPANGSVTRSFQVRVKYSLSPSLSYVMTNTYGNTVTIRINIPQVLGAFVAPKTGADTNAFVFSTMLTALAAVFQKRKTLMQLIFT